VDLRGVPRHRLPHAAGRAGGWRPQVIAYSSALPHASTHASTPRQGGGHLPVPQHPAPVLRAALQERSRLPHFLSSWTKRLDRRPSPDAGHRGFVTEGTGATSSSSWTGLEYPTTATFWRRERSTHRAGGRLGSRSGGRPDLYEAYNAEEAFWTTTSYCILPSRASTAACRLRLAGPWPAAPGEWSARWGGHRGPGPALRSA